MASFRTLNAVRCFSTTASRSNIAKAPIQVFGLEGRYAHALYSAAVKEKKLDVVEKDLTAVSGMIKENKDFANFLRNPLLKATERKAVMTEILKKMGVSNLTENTFLCLADNRRLKNTDSVLKAFAKIMAAVRGEVNCEVVTAKPLDGAAQKELKTALEGFLQKGQVLHMQIKTDPSLIGGMVVSIGDKYLDMSMKTKINAYTGLIKMPV